MQTQMPIIEEGNVLQIYRLSLKPESRGSLGRKGRCRKPAVSPP